MEFKIKTILMVLIAAIVFLCIPTFQAQSCAYAPADKGKRAFGMDILNVLPNKTYQDNLEKLKELHGSFQHFSTNWNFIEPGKESYEDTNNYLAMINGVAESTQTKITLVFRPIDTTGKMVPEDLQDTPFNSPVMINRFMKALDFTLSKINPQNLNAVMIGNEIDTYNPAKDKNFWVEYSNFLRLVTVESNKKYPGLEIGFVATLSGIADSSQRTLDGWPTQKVMQTMAEFVNVVGVTYYPLDAGVQVKSRKDVQNDMKQLLEAIPSDIPIHFTEVGFPSSASNGSSPQLQADFFCEFLHQWDIYKTRIPQVSVLRLNDVSSGETQETAKAYNFSSENFNEYLRTLGLFEANGTAKPAFIMLQEQLSKRNF